MASLRSLLGEVFFPDGSKQHAFPRIDLMIAGSALIVGLLLVGADVYQRWVAPDDIETLNIDGHNNPATWFHAAVLTGAALCALGIAFTVFESRRRWLWLVLGTGIGFFSLDKTITLHERAGRKIEDVLGLPHDAGRLAWQAAWSPIILVVLAALVLCLWESNRRTQLWALGLVLGGAGKLVLEALTFPAVHYFNATENTGWFYGLEVNIEESLQLAAFVCLFAGFAQLLVDRLQALARGEIEVFDEEHRAEGRALPAAIVGWLPIRRRSVETASASSGFDSAG